MSYPGAYVFPPPVGIYACSYCSKEADSTCSQCRNIEYCSRKCQVTHWKTHKKECRSSTLVQLRQVFPVGVAEICWSFLRVRVRSRDAERAAAMRRVHPIVDIPLEPMQVQEGGTMSWRNYANRVH